MPMLLLLALHFVLLQNHVGFYVAKEKGWYAEKGLEVGILSPHTDGYKVTPGEQEHGCGA